MNRILLKNQSGKILEYFLVGNRFAGTDIEIQEMQALNALANGILKLNSEEFQVVEGRLLFSKIAKEAVRLIDRKRHNVKKEEI